MKHNNTLTSDRENTASLQWHKEIQANLLDKSGYLGIIRLPISGETKHCKCI